MPELDHYAACANKISGGVGMAKKVIVEHRNQGCMHGCLVLLGWVLVVGIAIMVLAYVGAIAAGVGLWFLIRYIWRQYVKERPDSELVKRGMRLAPITRKVLAGVLCALVSLSLCGIVSGMGSQSKSSSTAQTQQQTTTAKKKSSKTEKNSGKSSKKSTESETAAKTQTPTFDPNGYGLRVEVATPSAGQYKAIVSVYGNTNADFATMRKCVIDAAAHYGMAEDSNTVGAEFDRIIGSEGGSGMTWTDGGIVTSAPNGTEKTYRADLYVKK
jgi:hypothetical protein